MLQKFTTQELVTLPSNIFPLKDFQSDDSGAPVHVPQDCTHLFVTPLHLAAYHGKDEVVQLLSAFWESNLHLAIGSTTPLFLSLLNGHRSTSELLSERGATLRGKSWANSLHAAARQGMLAEIQESVRVYDMDPDCEDKDSATPVVYALYLPEEQALETISLLFALGAKKDAQLGDNYCWTYADLARAMGKEGLASWLESRADDSFAYTVEFVQAQLRNMNVDQ
ncbi:Ankyrin repeat and SOCS box protein 3 [Tolypocladium ophioglossoides CBS 100239]|uniref:Ankyrin repeat and SOCS box protein 3 n=1 Tax=Tolypocladium ophioglossoides (strain CBS 100239) TaxID=1163406 RepID=A0A0L0MWC9_TOLOC|nr:Ankyrin repeat and SOCS box protein 3 [Tolypocladium ophioglossoides CBS 100239]